MVRCDCICAFGAAPTTLTLRHDFFLVNGLQLLCVFSLMLIFLLGFALRLLFGGFALGLDALSILDDIVVLG